MDSISYASNRGLSPAPSDPVPTQMRVLQWTNGDVSSDLFEVGTAILFSAQPSLDFQAQWCDAKGNPLSASFALQNGALTSLGTSVELDGSQVTMTISPVEDQKTQWQGQVTPFPKPVVGNPGTFIAQADPDPQPPVLG